MMSNGLQGRKDRLFELFYYGNFNLNNLTRNAAPNSGNLWYVTFAFGTWATIPLGASFKIYRHTTRGFQTGGLGSQEVQYKIFSSGAVELLPLRLTSTSVLTAGDTGNLDPAPIFEGDFVATGGSPNLNLLFIQIRKTILSGASGQIIANGTIYCEWIVHPSEVSL